MTNWNSIAKLPPPPESLPCPRCGRASKVVRVDESEYGQSTEYYCGHYCATGGPREQGFSLWRSFYCERCGEQQQAHCLVKLDDGKEFFVCRKMINNATFLPGGIWDEA
jgi:transcription elongation factor Elf1